uniref:Uncharacterized protein n=1 Tax=Rhizophora mucronata TaxID=61149 RepID=A0A2P2QDG8_RHIMU
MPLIIYYFLPFWVYVLYHLLKKE